MTTSSASPENLNVFVTRAGVATNELGARIAQVKQQLEAYLAMPSDYKFVNGEAVIGDVASFNSSNLTDEHFVATVRQAFLTADSNTLPDAVIAKALADAGVSLAPRQAVTVDVPTFNGKPITSGFSDDPVCTATGHFLDVVDDLAMPDPLRVLRWTRTYSSRFIVATGHGRGWYSWASVQLVEQDGEIDYLGPDGQAAVFLPTDTDILGNPGVEASVQRDGEGLLLRWRWSSRFPGMTWRFDAGGRLRRIEDPFSGTTICEHDGDGRLASMVHQGGRRLDIEWGGARIVAVASSDGRRVAYDYNDGGDLTRAHRPGGAYRYMVDANGRITEVVDADDVRLVANEYDDEGRVTSQLSPFGRRTRYRYLMPLTVIVGDDEGGPVTLFRHDVAGRLVELHTAEGTRMTRQFDDMDNPVQVVALDGGVTRREFDIAGNCVAEVRPDGSELRWRYDERGRVVAYIDGAGAELRMTYDGDAYFPSTIEGPLGWRRTFEFHPDQSPLPSKITDADGVAWDIERDADGMVTALRDADGQRIEFGVHRSGVVNELRLPTGERWLFDVDDEGRLQGETGPTGDRREITLSPAGRTRVVREGDGGTVALAYGPHGALAALTDAMGAVTSIDHDVLGNLVGVEWPGGARWRFDYDRMGQPIRVEDPLGSTWVQHWSTIGTPGGITDPVGYRWDEEADSLGRLVARVSPLGQRQDIGYDRMGRPIEVTTSAGATTAVARDLLGRPTQLTVDGSPVARYTYTPAGRVRAVLAPDGSTWRFEYDRLGRLVMIEQPDGGRDHFEYDASSRLIAYTTAEGRRSEFLWGLDGRPAGMRQGQRLIRYVRDGVGRITELHLPGGGLQRVVYDARGDVVEVVDPLGGRTRLRRDQLGNVVTLIDAKGAKWEWNYDAAGRLIGATDPIGRQIRIQLDPTGRLDTLLADDGVAQHYSWDPDGQLQSVATERRPLVLVERDGTGRDVRVLHGTGDGGGVVTELAFDQRGRMVAHQIGERRTSWHYDDDRRVTTVTPPSGEPVEVTVDADGRPTAVEQGRMGRVELGYDLDGQVTHLRSAGLHRSWQRDDQGRVRHYREDRVGGPSRRVELVRDDAGRVVEERRDDGTWSYRYDAAGQLIGADSPDGNWEWHYDEVGRLTEERGPAGTRHFGYDDADQLRRVDGPTGETLFEYDASGRRIAERRPTETVRYRWDETGRLEAIERESASGLERIDVQVDVIGWLSGVAGMALEWTPGGTLGELPVSIGDRQVVVLPGIPIAATSSGPDGSVEWLSADWRGTIGDHPGPWAVSDPSGPEPQLGYLGEVEVGGLVWLRNRLYDPATHCFLSPDPSRGLSRYPGGLSNPYGYANNDPLGWLDPLGLRPLSIDEANAQMQSWRHGHWQELAVAAVAIAGTVAICVATGGLAAPIMAGIGFAAAGGGTILNAKLTHQEIDWGNVLMNASMGGLLGAGAAAITPAAAVAVRVGVGGAYGTTTGAASSVVTQAFGTGEFNMNTIDPKAVAVDAAFGGVEGLIPPVRNADMNIAGLPQVPKSTELIYNSVIQGHYQPIAQSGAAIGKANLPGAMPPGPPAPPGPVNAQQLSKQLDQYR